MGFKQTVAVFETVKLDIALLRMVGHCTAVR
jgi:hypothetical protein